MWYGECAWYYIRGRAIDIFSNVIYQPEFQIQGLARPLFKNLKL